MNEFKPQGVDTIMIQNGIRLDFSIDLKISGIDAQVMTGGDTPSLALVITGGDGRVYNLNVPLLRLDVKEKP